MNRQIIWFIFYFSYILLQEYRIDKVKYSPHSKKILQVHQKGNMIYYNKYKSGVPSPLASAF